MLLLLLSLGERKLKKNRERYSAYILPCGIVRWLPVAVSYDRILHFINICFVYAHYLVFGKMPFWLINWAPLRLSRYHFIFISYSEHILKWSKCHRLNWLRLLHMLSRVSIYDLYPQSIKWGPHLVYPQPRIFYPRSAVCSCHASTAFRE